MEVMVLVHAREFVDAMRQIEDDHRANSRLLALEEWLRRPRREQVFDNLMRLTSSLM
jgi:cardiolipin synthase